jgi:hypothetical protein
MKEDGGKEPPVTLSIKLLFKFINFEVSKISVYIRYILTQ